MRQSHKSKHNTVSAGKPLFEVGLIFCISISLRYVYGDVVSVKFHMNK